MKQTVLVAAFLAAAHLSMALPSIHTKNKFKDSTTSIVPSIEDVFDEIVHITGQVSSFELKEAKVLNLEVSGSRRKKLILYNPNYTNWITDQLNNKWGLALLLAHEIGHHNFGHLKHKRKDRHAAELEADEYAGYILAKMGASLEEAQLVMKTISGVKASSTHPGRAKRIDALKKGWIKALFAKL